MKVEKGQLGVLALDLGSHTGFEVMSRGTFSRDIIDLTRKGRFSEDGFYSFECSIAGLIRLLMKYNNQVEVVVEKPHAGRYFHSAKILFGLLGILHSFCQRKGIIVTEFSPKAIKKYWTGNGNSPKEEMVAKAQQLVSKHIKNHNIADACALMRFYLEQRKDKDE